MVIVKDNLTININEIACVSEASKYDEVFLEESPFRLSTIIEVIVFNGNKKHKSAVIGATMGATGVHNTSYIVENERLILCCSNYIICLSLPDLKLLWRTVADTITCFEVFKYKNKYIVHGELQISCLDRNGNIVWQQGGANIFTTPEGVDTFELKDQYIIAKDWNYKIYKFDYDGNIL